MGFVLIGVLFIVLRVGGWVQFHPDDFWAWVIVLSPFALAVVWWGWSDATGLTKRKAMQVLDEKKEARRAQLMEEGRPRASRRRLDQRAAQIGRGFLRRTSCSCRCGRRPQGIDQPGLASRLGVEQVQRHAVGTHSLVREEARG